MLRLVSGKPRVFTCPEFCATCCMSGTAGAVVSSGNEGHVKSTALVFPATPDYVHHAVTALKKGLVVAVPTDTLYGLAANACSGEAIQKIYSIKGRNIANPLAVCLAHPEEFQKYSVTSHLPGGLLQDLFPGPVTAVLLRGEHSLLDKCLNPGLVSIGIRIPDSGFIRQVAEVFGSAIALTSANISGQPSTIRIQEFEALWPHCAAVFDAGELPSTGEGSTIVDLTVPDVFKILRTGSALVPTVELLKKHGLQEAPSD